MYQARNKPSLLLNDETLTVVRFAPTTATVVDGLRVRDPTGNLTFTCIGNVQPLSGRDLAMAPEGEREQGQLNWWVWRDQPYQPQAGDLVKRLESSGTLVDFEQNYLVTSATDWGSYVLCRLARDDASTLRNG